MQCLNIGAYNRIGLVIKSNWDDIKTILHGGGQLGSRRLRGVYILGGKTEPSMKLTNRVAYSGGGTAEIPSP